MQIAQFVGTPRINVIPATATANGVDVLGTRLPVACGLAPGTPLQIGIRPGRLLVNDGDACLAGHLTFRENLGSDLFLHVQVNGMGAPMIARCDPAEGHLHSLGDRIRLALAPEHVLLFGMDGRRLRIAARQSRERTHA